MRASKHMREGWMKAARNGIFINPSKSTHIHQLEVIIRGRREKMGANRYEMAARLVEVGNKNNYAFVVIAI